MIERMRPMRHWSNLMSNIGNLKSDILPAFDSIMEKVRKFTRPRNRREIWPHTISYTDWEVVSNDMRKVWGQFNEEQR